MNLPVVESLHYIGDNANNIGLTPGRWICRWSCGREPDGRLPGLPPQLASLLLQAQTHDSWNVSSYYLLSHRTPRVRSIISIALTCNIIIIIFILVMIILTWRSFWPPRIPGASRGQDTISLLNLNRNRNLLKIWKRYFRSRFIAKNLSRVQSKSQSSFWNLEAIKIHCWKSFSIWKIRS